MGRFLALTGRCPAGVRLLRDRHPHRRETICADGDRAGQPSHEGPGRDRAPDRGMGCPGGAQSGHGPGGRQVPGTVPDPRSGRAVPAGVRRYPRRRRDPDRAHRRNDAADERGDGTLGSDLPTRTLRPDADPEPAPSHQRATRVRDSYPTHRPHRALGQGSPLGSRPTPINDPDRIVQLDVRRGTGRAPAPSRGVGARRTSPPGGPAAVGRPDERRAPGEHAGRGRDIGPRTLASPHAATSPTHRSNTRWR